MPSARVLIDGPSGLVFDYAVPAGMPVVPGCRVKVPLRAKSTGGTVLSLEDEAQPGFKMREIVELSDPEPLLTPALLETGRWIADYYGSRTEAVIRALLPEAVRTEEHGAKTRRIAVLGELPDDEELEKISRRATRQYAIIELLRAAPDNRLPVADLGSNAAAPVRTLASRGIIRVVEEDVRRDPDADGVEPVQSKPIDLTDEQAAALDSINEALLAPKAEVAKPILLHGVTGSGKTEVYLQATAKVLELGRTVLVLVPEISLTPQTVRRFRSRFAALGEQVAVLHSHLSQGERFDEWHRIRKGGARIVIGARSAVFAPLPELGLILVDEEHENSYKQENPPRYHGRDVAVLRSRIEGCAVVLGSATPSLESFHNAQTGKYQLLRLTKRIDDRKLPLIRVVDLRMEAKKRKRGAAILSDRLRSELGDKLTRSEQVILFLNRRGFARSLQCPKCGHVCTCPHCAVALTYHRTDERLVCHVCGHQAVVPRRCPECRDPAILLQGFGTQKVEEVLNKVLPDAKIARIDADVARRKNALRDMLNDFKANKIDVLIGTQMIAKGLHFPERHPRRHPQRRPLSAHPGLPRRRAHLPAPHPGRRPRRPRRTRGRGRHPDLHPAFALGAVRTPPRLRRLRRAGTRVPPPVRLSAIHPLRAAHRPLDPRAARRVHAAVAPPAARRGPARRDYPRRTAALAAGQGARSVSFPAHPARPQTPRTLPPRPANPRAEPGARRRDRGLRHGRSEFHLNPGNLSAGDRKPGGFHWRSIETMDASYVALIALAVLIVGLFVLKRLRQVPASKALELLRAGALVLDVRSSDEFATDHVPKAVNLPLEQVQRRIADLAPEHSKPILVHCLSGTRSGMACRILRGLGYTRVHNLGSLGRARSLVRKM
jgi:primosomal protein N' (replication factor Y)